MSYLANTLIWGLDSRVTNQQILEYYEFINNHFGDDARIRKQLVDRCNFLINRTL